MSTPKSLLTLSEIPNLTLLYKLHKLTPSSSPPTNPPSAKYNSFLSLIRHDITRLQLSAIVNAANTRLAGGGGVDGAIHSRAGPGLLRECATLDGCATGSAKITGAYKLPCERVIHAVGPVYWVAREDRPGAEKELLTGCYRKSLELAVENGCTSVAFSCLSTGVYGYPSGEAAEAVLETVRAWMEENESGGFGGLERVVFCCFEEKDERAYKQLIPKFFPPVEEHEVAEETAGEESELAKSMPDPPKGEPKQEGQPDSKKQKVAAEDDKKPEPVEKVEVGTAADNNEAHPAAAAKDPNAEAVSSDK